MTTFEYILTILPELIPSNTKEYTSESTLDTDLPEVLSTLTFRELRLITVWQACAKVSAWQANTNYEIGDTVEYDAKFFVAKKNHNSQAKFNFENWIKKDKKPAPTLIPNFLSLHSNSYLKYACFSLTSATIRQPQHLSCLTWPWLCS